MRLLVSVRSEAEVAAALEGGADILDAKEPERGSLGAVDPATLAGIADALPSGVPLSVALGDPGGLEAVAEVMERMFDGARIHADYLKLGFAGVERPETVRLLLAAAVTAASALPGQPRVIAVAYADHLTAACPPPSVIAQAAASAGAAGVLLDTSTKDGRDLFAWLSATALADWVAEVHRYHLLASVAGSLRPDSIPTVVRAEPDIVGVRGAACLGGRQGRVSPSRVRALRSTMDSTSIVTMA